MNTSSQSTEAVYPTINEALRDFQGLCGFLLDSVRRKEVAELIEQNGLSRRFVSELAGEVNDESTKAPFDFSAVWPKRETETQVRSSPPDSGPLLQTFAGQGIA